MTKAPPLCPYHLQLAKEMTPLLAATPGTVGPVPHWGSTVELTLLERAQVSWSRNVSMGDLVLALTCHMVAWVWKR